jgi:CPA1 family monovalent cation:H+ antiporter
LILFLTFIVILATLVLQGTSLPFLIRWLGIKDDRSAEKEERAARLKANEAALVRLKEIAEREPAKAEAANHLRVEYEDRVRQLEAYDGEASDSRPGLFSSEYESLSSQALAVERRIIVTLRDQGVINDEVLRRVQRDIDLAEARLRQPQ